MKADLAKIRKRRVYSEEFKKRIVSEFESGEFSVLQLGKLYGINNVTIYNWIYKFSTFNDKSIHVVEMKDSSSKKLKDLESKVKELESALGRKQLYVDYMEKMIELAKDEYDIDIKKNSNTQQSVGSKKTKKK